MDQKIITLTFTEADAQMILRALAYRRSAHLDRAERSEPHLNRALSRQCGLLIGRIRAQLDAQEGGAT